ncbi:hypothetical protein EJ06DRAFT_532735 [Trichodelitschia bisporula]|uniref:Uncharacterized protein n=1 Tax=Trichodelitschia bisporula TaxID=703511 RepID=A0A6G1HNV4_9PEZI|nr:hypothetical protein EJ06DRAFT_532735 [Trichodelitschia bisporula]
MNDPSPEEQNSNSPAWTALRLFAIFAAIVLIYILYRVLPAAYALYARGELPLRARSRLRGQTPRRRFPYKTSGNGRYVRLSREEEEELLEEDEEEEVYRDDSIDFGRSTKPLPERPLPDKPLPPVPGDII